ncbi:MazG family protein [Microcella frigidaquae]|uniref:XTP/dITP diphosphohydrolase n=1 Tax=Microcella frigidaquae TaxID=424758 RepID=A0A840X512_9MICO|nr:MazG family protein [Microcella frigidaquae]MBB5617470.1 XTP/dITP diphosphohydrolase [Microcella frigidaquae]NHN45339.1 MazG family protein [Microcella frigidaquae]
MTEPASPALPPAEPHPQLDQLIAVLAHLRAPGGCAWDAEQTHESLTQYLVEEAHELIDAIEHGTPDDVLEELGDVLYQVLFHADIAAARGADGFTIEDVAARSIAKMVGRHPHVFGDVVADTADEVAANWDTWKRQEKPARTSVLDGVPRGLPALQRAEKLLGRADDVGFAPVLPAVDAPADERVLGAELLALVAAARARGLQPERALRLALSELEADIRHAEQRDGSARGGADLLD